jgi:hypothetical protein
MGNTVEARKCLRRLKDLKSNSSADLEKEIAKIADNKSVSDH